MRWARPTYPPPRLTFWVVWATLIRYHLPDRRSTMGPLAIVQCRPASTLQVFRAMSDICPEAVLCPQYTVEVRRGRSRLRKRVKRPVISGILFVDSDVVDDVLLLLGPARSSVRRMRHAGMFACCDHDDVAPLVSWADAHEAGDLCSEVVYRPGDRVMVSLGSGEVSGVVLSQEGGWATVSSASGARLILPSLLIRQIR